MKIGLLSDAHGNIIGLKTCIDFLLNRGVDKIFFLGDAVGYLPESHNIFELLEAFHVSCILGNHDAMLIGRIGLNKEKDTQYQISQIWKTISLPIKDFIETCLPFHEAEYDGQRFLMVHGSPWDPLNGYIYPDSNIDGFSGLPYEFIVMGHTHRPFIRQLGKVTLVNVGSCGLPRDQGNLSSCAICNTVTGTCEIFRIPFNSQWIIETYQDQIHPNVIECLLRKENHIVGTIIKEEHYGK